MADITTTPRRRFRFSLRTLLLFITLCTVASWAYWFGWPWWKLYRFESALQHLKAGATTYDLMQLGRRSRGTSYQGGYAGNVYGMTTFEVPSGLYCVYFTYTNVNGAMMQRPCDTVKVYHLSPVPSDFQPKSIGPKVDRVSEYTDDFMRSLYDPAAPRFAYQFQLINSDPPEGAAK